MGVPVITLAGKTHASRVSASLLANTGLEDLIAETMDDYREKAVLLAQNLHRLENLREGMRGRMAQSPLTDARRFTTNLEKCYRDMWIKWCTA